MNEFRVGDEVLFTYHPKYDIGHGTEPDGLTGVVCDLGPHGNIGVSFYEMVYGHTCSGYCDDGHGWYVMPESITLTSPQVNTVVPESFLSVVLEAINET